MVCCVCVCVHAYMCVCMRVCICVCEYVSVCVSQYDWLKKLNNFNMSAVVAIIGRCHLSGIYGKVVLYCS